jgi:hypothetical protein
MSRRTQRARRVAALMAAALLAATPVRAQLALQIKPHTGATWTNAINVPLVDVIDLRWQWGGSQAPSGATWQLSTATTPPSEVNLRTGMLAAEGPVQVIPSGSFQWSQFSIARSVHLPSITLPTVFHFRIRAVFGRTARVSTWVRVTTLTKADLALPDLRCELSATVLSAPGADPSSFLNWLKVSPGEIVTVGAYPIPPKDVNIRVTLANVGQREATFGLSFNGTVDGVIDVSSVQTVTLAAGMTKPVSFPEWTRVTEWDIGKDNAVTAKAVIDPSNAVKEMSETNNQCSLAFVVIPQGLGL